MGEYFHEASEHPVLIAWREEWRAIVKQIENWRSNSKVYSKNDGKCPLITEERMFLSVKTLTFFSRNHVEK